MFLTLKTSDLQINPYDDKDQQLLPVRTCNQKIHKNIPYTYLSRNVPETQVPDFHIRLSIVGSRKGIFLLLCSKMSLNDLILLLFKQKIWKETSIAHLSVYVLSFPHS